MTNPFFYGNTETTGLVRDLRPVDVSGGDDNLGGAKNVAIGLYITGAGDVVFTNADGTDRTVTVGALSHLLCSVATVKQTGTTATGIFAMMV